MDLLTDRYKNLKTNWLCKIFFVFLCGVSCQNVFAAFVPPLINSAATATGTLGSFFVYQITATNSPTSFNAINLPPGLSVNTATGFIFGIPTESGTTDIGLTATNNASETGVALLRLSIAPNAVPTITSSTTATGTVGSSFSYTIIATNSPTSYNATGLPPGLSVNTATGQITGTPTTSGTTIISLTATNIVGTSTPVTLILSTSPNAVPIISSSIPATGTVGSPFNYNITATNSPTSYNATGLPPGLSVNTATGLISGTPTTSGTTIISLTATNSVGTSAPATLTLSIAPNVVPTITSSTTATGTVGSSFNYNITASNSPTSYNASSLPPGLSVNTATGQITGTPTTSGTTTISLTATNSVGTSNPVTLTLSIAPSAVPTITSSTTATGTVGSPFNYNITASNSPTSYNATGLPQGLSVNTATGLISGTPTTSGGSTISLTATNSSGTGSISLIIMVDKFIPANPTQDMAVTGLVNAQKISTQLFAQTNINQVANHLQQVHENSGLKNNNLTLGIRSALLQPYQDFINASQNLMSSYEQNFKKTGLLTIQSSTAPENRSSINPNEFILPNPGSMKFGNIALNEMLLEKFGMSFWGAANTAYGKITTPVEPKDRFTLDEMIAGLDFKTTKKLLTGLAISYATNENKLNNLNAKSTSNQLSVIGYSTYLLKKNWFIDALIGYGSPSFANNRQSMDNGEFFYSNRNGNMTFGSLALSNLFKLNTVMTQLFCRADLVSAKLNQFAEQGGAMALSYSSLNTSNAALSAGVVLSKNIPINSWVVTPSAKTQYIYNYGSNNPQGLFYTNLGSSQFSYNFNVGNIPTNEGSFGLGLNFSKLHGGVLSVEWLLSTGTYDYSMNSFNIRLSYPFT